jgi:hypothetical protein
MAEKVADRRTATSAPAGVAGDGVPSWRRRARRIHVSKRVQTLVAVLVYALVAIQLTWPLVKDLNDIIFGAFGDLTGGMATMRETVEGGHNPFTPGHLADFSAPDGRPVEWTQNAASFSSTLVLYLLTAAFGAVAGFELFTLGGFVASGTAMFLLVRRLTGNFWISLLIGWAFAFYPYPVIKAGGHIHFVHGWPLVLILWRMLALYEAPTLRNGIFAGLATVLALSWSPYFLLIGGVAFAALFAVGVVAPFVRKLDVRAHLRSQLVAAGIVWVFAGVLVVISAASARGTGTEDHTLTALYTYAARPFEYLVPPAGNYLVGDDTGPWLQRHIHGSNFAESTLYVGLSLVALSVVALVAAARRRLNANVTQVVAAAAVVGVVALAFSAPPKVSAFGELFTFPSAVVHDVTGAWRVYARFVMVVMTVVCVLAAIGLQRVLRGRSQAVQALILAAVAVVVVADLRSRPVGTNTLDDPPIYAELKSLPEGLVAEYPIEPAGHGDYSAEFYQDLHDKPIINGYAKGSLSELRALGLARLESAATPGRLRTLGVRYVVVTHVPLDPGVTPPGTPGRGLRLVAPGRYASLYEVDAAPRPLVTVGPGFSLPEKAPRGRTYQWLTADDGELEVRADCSKCDATLEVEAQSFARPRILRLRDSQGRTVAERRIGSRPQTVSFPVRFNGRALYEVTTSPGREPIARVTGGPDPRSVSVSLTRPRLRLRSPGA